MSKKAIIIMLSDLIAIVNYSFRKAIKFFTGEKDNNKLRILLYHSVRNMHPKEDPNEENVTPAMFRRHIRALRNMPGNVVGLEEGVDALEKGSLSRRSVSITFDDGLLNAYNNAVGILEEFKMPATFFITYEYADAGGNYMDWPKVISLKEKGFGIGVHARSHRRLNRLSDEEIKTETVNAREMFREKGIDADFFAYPYGFYGDFSERTERAVRKSGYKACFTGIMGENRPGDNLLEIKRTRVSWRDNPFRFRLKIEGAYDWVDSLKRMLAPGS